MRQKSWFSSFKHLKQHPLFFLEKYEDSYGEKAKTAFINNFANRKK